MLDSLDSDLEFLKRVCFNDECTIQVSGMLNGHNLRIWTPENPHETRELKRDIPKVNVLGKIMHDSINGPFFFAKKLIASQIYLFVLTE